MKSNKKLKKELKKAWRELIQNEVKPIETLWDFDAHVCCWHTFVGMIHMVIPQGKKLEQCCKCDRTRLVTAYPHILPRYTLINCLRRNQTY